MKLFDNPKKAVYIILAFVLLFLVYLEWGPTADGAEFEIGAAHTGEFNGAVAIVFSERFKDVFDVGITLIGEQQWEQVDPPIGNNGNVWAQYVAKRPDNWWRILPSELGVGAAYWIKTDRLIIGCHVGYWLSIKWRVKKWSLAWRHGSNAGICDSNRGQDLVLIGRRF